MILGEFPVNFLQALLRVSNPTFEGAPALKLKQVESLGQETDAAELEVAKRYYAMRSAIRKSQFYSQFVMEAGEGTFGIFQRGNAGKRLATGLNKKNFLEEVEIVVDICPTSSDDPWDLSGNSTPEEDNRQKRAKEHRERYILQATEILGLQHRTNVFAISIHGAYARMLYVDRAGVLVSERFNYFNDCAPLEQLLFRYLRATPRHRGFDDSATKASLEDTLHFEKAIREYLANEDNIHLPGFEKTLVPGAHTYVLRVPRTRAQKGADTEYLEYIVQRPFFKKTGLGHNGTQGYLAWGRSEQRVLFLKDMWRGDCGSLSETAMYEQLGAVDVPNLPTVYSGGDIKWQIGFLQTAVSARYVSAQYVKPLSGKLDEERYHHRLVQDLAYPVRMVRSSRELVQVIRDALQAIEHAWKGGRILHSDISTGNVMMDKNGNGILNDWDIAVQVLEVGLDPGRRGTWRFMSVNQLAEPPSVHGIQDDVESCFWVLLYIAIHYFAGSRLVPTDSDHLTLFEEYVKCDDAGNCRGGLCKHAFLTDGFATTEITFDCKPLTDVIRAFAKILCRFYNPMALENDNDADEVYPGEISQAEWNKRSAKARRALRNVKDITKIFDDALEGQGWPKEPDAVHDQWPKSEVFEHSLGWRSACDARNPVPTDNKKVLEKSEKIPPAKKPDDDEPVAGAEVAPKKKAAREGRNARELAEREKLQNDKKPNEEELPRRKRKRPVQDADVPAIGRNQYQTRLRTREEGKAKAGPVTRSKANKGNF